ncbi:hypothetical protein JCM10213_001861 [Rhodosporidiobolus nylandii]
MASFPSSTFGSTAFEDSTEDHTWERSDPLFGRQDDDDEPEHLQDAERDRLYSVLNLDRTASQDEIQRSYRRLAAILHPDRHSARDPSLKPAADARFAELQQAFEVLSDPHKRAVYDELGESGLKTQWEVGVRGKTAQELRAEYERLNRQQLEQNIEAMVRSKGDLTIISDARVAFLSPAELSRLTGEPEEDLALSAWQRLQTVQAKQCVLKHSFTTPINPATNVVVTSQLVARNGQGAGNLLFKLQHNPSSKLQLEIGTTLLRPRALTLKSTYSPSPDTFLRLETSPGIRTLSAPPKFTLTLGRRIYPKTTGILTLRSGAWAIGSWGAALLQPYSDSTLSLGLNHTSGWAAEATSAVFSKQLSVNYGTTVLGGFKVSAGGVVTSVGAFSVALSADRRVTENVKAGMGVEMQPNGALTVKLRVSRLGQRLQFPVLISSAFEPKLFLGFTLLPAAAMIGANHFFLGPRKRARLSGKLKELRKEHAEYIREQRKAALDAQALLSEHVRKRVAEEEAKNGLVIVEAIYGVLEAVAEDAKIPEDERRWVDVTVPLQSLLPPSVSQLTIPSGRSKSSLLGFYDPALGEKKQLRVRYRFKGRLHEVTYKDREAVGLPMRGHLVEEGRKGR